MSEQAGLVLGLLLLVLREKDGVDVGEDSAAGDGHAGEELVELFVVSDRELEVAGDDPRALVVPGGVAGELEDFSDEALQDGREVDRGAAADSETAGREKKQNHNLDFKGKKRKAASAGRVPGFSHVAGDTADGELEAGAGGPGDLLALALAFSLAAFAFSAFGSFACEKTKRFLNGKSQVEIQWGGPAAILVGVL